MATDETITAAELRKERARAGSGFLTAEDHTADLLESEERLRRQNADDLRWVARQLLPAELDAIAEAEAVYAKALEDLEDAKWQASTLVDTPSGFLDNTSGAAFIDRDNDDFRDAERTAEVALRHLNHVREWASAAAEARMAAVSARLADPDGTAPAEPQPEWVATSV